MTIDNTSNATSEGSASGELIRADDAAPPSWLDRARTRLPEIVTEQQPSLHELVSHSRHGDWTDDTDSDSLLRSAHLAWTYLVATPFTAAAYGVQWAMRTPGRALVAAIAVLIVATAANHIPVVHWLVPDGLDFTSWF